MTSRLKPDWHDINLAICEAMSTGRPFRHPRLESLHAELEALHLSSAWAESTVHGMIDRGLVRELRCEADKCLQPTRGFSPSNYRRDPNGLSIDHVTQRCDGGGHRLDNLRLVHYRCNCASLTGRKRPPEVGQKIGAKLRGRPLTEEHKQKLSSSRLSNTSISVSCVKCRKLCKGTYGLVQHVAKSACGKSVE